MNMSSLKIFLNIFFEIITEFNLIFYENIKVNPMDTDNCYGNILSFIIDVLY